MRILYLAIKDLTQIARDWKAAFFLLVMPIAFTFLFAFAFSSGENDSVDPRIPVGFVDLDNGILSPYLMRQLSASEVIRLDSSSADLQALEQRVKDEELVALVIIPEGFSDSHLSGDPSPLRLTTDSGSSAGITVSGEVTAAAARLANAVETADFSIVAYQDQLSADPDDRDRFFIDALENALAAWQTPPVAVNANASSVVDTGESDSTSDAEENPYTHTSPGMMAQFAIAGLMGASAIIVLERKSGALSRLITTPITRAGILTGHFLAMLILIFLQLLILMIFGQLFLDLDYFGRPLASLLIALSAAFFTASLGLLIGALAKNEDQVVIFGLIPMFILAGFGGAWVPMEIMPEGFQSFAKVTPLGWVIGGLQDIIIRGQGLDSVWVAGVALMAYSVVLLSLALWRFRFE